MIIFLIKSFNIIPIIKKKKIIRILSAKISSLEMKIKFVILNKFVIISRLN